MTVSKTAPQHRIRAAGIIVNQQAVLLLKVQDRSGEYWIPPGGGLEASDRHTKDCVQRECYEEAGIEVQVGDLLCVREFLETTSHRYHAEFFYSIEALKGQPHLDNLAGLNDQAFIQAVEWVAIERLATLRTFPSDLLAVVRLAQEKKASVHLGSYVQGPSETLNQFT
ncbi:NUDIX domain-containing protein [Vibrio aphrogenes]|uniref:NUDIX domain-containing protein n=1 Tax=Vibrio aphrogenes TaxID=1891186 RepID=UPI000B34CDAC|nr:NUDIX domain-containing protein [Vibrio aphrogenes]